MRPGITGPPCDIGKPTMRSARSHGLADLPIGAQHNPSDHHHRHTVAFRRRLVWPRTVVLGSVWRRSRGRPGPVRSPSRMGDTRRLGTTPVNNNPCTRGTRVIESTFDYYRTSLCNSRGEKAQAP